MVTRHEKVVLSLEDNFTTGMARAAAATALLDKNLDSLSGTSVSTARAQDQVTKSTTQSSTATEKATKKTKDYTLEMAKADVAASRLRKSLTEEAKAALDAEQRTGLFNRTLRDGSNDIDRYSGRLRLIGEAALVIGPALVPIGAVGVPAVVALAGGLAAAATSAGVALLAFHGVGDALKALDEYQIDPTAAHLEKMREEFEKIGPTGVQFVKFLDDIEPQLKDLQTVARAGIFPGVEDGITSLLSMLPQVRVILFELATEMGHLASEAGTALSGESFAAFFDYLETDAAPTLEAFAHTLGNVGAGLASLIVAFAPLSRDFSSGMEAMSASFADWAAGLSETDGFRDFVAYVRESGPQVLALLGSLATAFIGIVQAAAPVGGLVVPALTALANVLGAIAASPIGGPLFTAAAAMVALSRAAKLTSGALDKVGISSARTGTHLERIAGTAAGIAAVGIAVGAMADGIGRIKTEDLDRSLTALGDGDVTNQIDDIVGSLEELKATRNSIDFGEIATAGGLFGDTTLDKYADNVDQVDQRLAQLVESGHATEAANLFAQISKLAEEQGVSVEDTAGSFDAYAQAVENATGPSDAAAASARKLAQEHNRQAATADRAAESTVGLVGAMRDEATAALGAFDAETQYREALKAAAAQAKKNEAGISDSSKAALANRSALSGLAGAWNNQSNAVKNNVGRWKEARGAFIDTAVAMNVPIEKAKALADRLLEIPKTIVIRQNHNMDPAIRTAKLLAQAIRNIPTRWLTEYTINTVRTGTKPELHAPAGQTSAYGNLNLGDVANRHQPTLSRMPRTRIWNEPETGGESYIPHANDARRPRAKSILEQTAGMFGGSVAWHAGGGMYAQVGAGGTPMFALTSSADIAADALFNLAGLGKKELEVRTKLLNKEVERDQKAADAARDHRDAVLEDAKSLKASVAARFQSDLFGQSQSSLTLDGPEGGPTSAAQSLQWALAQQQVNAFQSQGQSPIDILHADIAEGEEANRLYKQLAAIYRKSGGKFTAAERRALEYAQLNADNSELAALVNAPQTAQQYANLYGDRQQVSNMAGTTAANQRYAAELRRSNTTLDAALVEAKQSKAALREANRRLHHLEKLAEKNPKETGDHVSTATNGASAAGNQRRVVGEW